jgi:hypothetical protein|tara:strand:+ start:52504 stop:53187 length:684 start_codon:yes stop_codon:yes gene_type:complete
MRSFKQFIITESVDGFFDDLENWGVLHFDGRLYYKAYANSTVTVELGGWSGGLRLSYIKATPHGSGAGSMFMSELVKKADEHNIKITGSVQSEEGGPSDQKLREFYRKFDFEIDGEDIERTPNATSPVIVLRGSGSPKKARSHIAELSEKYDWVVHGEHESGWENWEDALDSIWDNAELDDDVEDFKNMVYGESGDDSDLAEFINDELEKLNSPYSVSFTGESEDDY